MSVFFAVKYADNIQLLTDGASWDQSGALAKVGSKVYVSKTLPLAITGRGEAAFVDLLAARAIAEADSLGSVDAMMVLLSGVLLDVKRSVHDRISHNDMHFDMCVCGFSETRGLFISNINTWGTHEAPYVVNDRPCASVGCYQLSESHGAELQRGMPLTDPRFFKTRGLELMEVVRKSPVPKETPWFSQVKVVGAGAGGLCELTTITSVGAETELLATYDDPIGAPINPYREAHNVKLMANRKDRRAAKATGRKVA